ncbi:MAG: chemotaxis protein CheD [Candidatus Thermoplasmatota archaeon]|nr:chemotaxis protein CheD [Candidatus Thermoplasmatota archaeon]
MPENVVIGIGDYAVSHDGSPLSTVGLGSCIGIVIYDSRKKIAGLSHIMLPTVGSKKDRIGKYADTAIPALLDEMRKKGSRPQNCKAKIAGGASLFTFKDDSLQIGKRNAEAVENVLREYRIRIVGKDVGGDRGRTITFYPDSEELHIRMVKKGRDGPNIKVI